jgi:hypothetical protein
LRDNILAQKLFVKIHVILRDESAARSVYEHLKVNRLLDAETRRYGEILELQGFVTAHQRLLKDLSDAGIVLAPEAEASQPSSVASKSPENLSKNDGKPTGIKFIGDEELEVRDEDAIAGFHAVPLKDIFNPGDGSNNLVQAGLKGNAAHGGKSPGKIPGKSPGIGVELDSTTLADIYARQGHFAKALAIYRRLLRMAPQNELLRRKVAELQEQDRKQRDIDADFGGDGSVDLAVADRMETLEVIVAQIRFYQDLLATLGA